MDLSELMHRDDNIMEAEEELVEDSEEEREEYGGLGGLSGPITLLSNDSIKSFPATSSLVLPPADTCLPQNQVCSDITTPADTNGKVTSSPTQNMALASQQQNAIASGSRNLPSSDINTQVRPELQSSPDRRATRSSLSPVIYRHSSPANSTEPRPLLLELDQMITPQGESGAADPGINSTSSHVKAKKKIKISSPTTHRRDVDDEDHDMLIASQASSVDPLSLALEHQGGSYGPPVGSSPMLSLEIPLLKRNRSSRIPNGKEEDNSKNNKKGRLTGKGKATGKPKGENLPEDTEEMHEITDEEHQEEEESRYDPDVPPAPATSGPKRNPGTRGPINDEDDESNFDPTRANRAKKGKQTAKPRTSSGKEMDSEIPAEEEPDSSRRLSQLEKDIFGDDDDELTPSPQMQRVAPKGKRLKKKENKKQRQAQLENWDEAVANEDVAIDVNGKSQRAIRFQLSSSATVGTEEEILSPVKAKKGGKEKQSKTGNAKGKGKTTAIPKDVQQPQEEEEEEDIIEVTPIEVTRDRGTRSGSSVSPTKKYLKTAAGPSTPRNQPLTSRPLMPREQTDSPSMIVGKNGVIKEFRTSRTDLPAVVATTGGVKSTGMSRRFKIPSLHRNIKTPPKKLPPPPKKPERKKKDEEEYSDGEEQLDEYGRPKIGPGHPDYWKIED